MKALLGLVMAMVLISPVWAGPGVTPHAPAGSAIILVEGGCGPEAHRDWEGRCRPNYRDWERMERERRFERLECPRGYHLGPEGRRCWPN